MPSLNINEATWNKLQAHAKRQNLSVEAYIEKWSDAPDTALGQTTTQEILSGISVGVLVQGTQAEMLMGNQAALDMLGLTWDQLMGKTSFDPDWNVIHEDGSNFPGEKHPVPQAIATGQPVHDVIMGVYRPTYRDHIWLSVNAVPQFDEDGVLKQVICTFTDVTAQKQAEFQLAQANIELEARVAERTQDLAIANTKLQDSENQLRLITENVSDLFILHDLDGTYQYVSASCEEMLGFTAAEMLGTDPYDYIHPQHIEDVKKHHQKMLSAGVNDNITYRFRTASGEYIWLESRVRIITDGAGVSTYILTASRDVTQRILAEKELRDERNLLHSIAEASPVGITVVDRNGHIIFANPRSEQILGITKSELTARTYDAPAWRHTDYDGNPWPDEQQPFVRVMQTKQPVWDVRHAIEDEDGKRIFLAINGMPILDEAGNVDKAVLTVEDYTARKLQEDKLQASLERERNLGELKTKFISMVSHEFRTPMAIMMTTTGLIRRKADHIDPDDLLKRLERIDRQVQRLDLLIRDVTLINRTEAGLVPVPMSINLNHFFEQLLNDVQFEADEKDVSIRYMPHRLSCELYQDEALMHQIFNNLLSNAIKYSPAGSSVDVAYVCQDDTFIVTVQDSGIGIPAEAQASLFTPFFRAENVGAISGTGLGLAIVQRAVNALDGHIMFSSAENEGTTFRVILPMVLDNVTEPTTV